MGDNVDVENFIHTLRSRWVQVDGQATSGITGLFDGNPNTNGLCFGWVWNATRSLIPFSVVKLHTRRTQLQFRYTAFSSSFDGICWLNKTSPLGMLQLVTCSAHCLLFEGCRLSAHSQAFPPAAFFPVSVLHTNHKSTKDLTWQRWRLVQATALQQENGTVPVQT